MDVKKQITKYLKLFAAVIAIGVLSGIIGTAFHEALYFAAKTFMENTWLIYIIIPIGFIIVALYKLLKVSTSYSTVSVIKAVRNGEKVPAGLSASIFCSTFLTHIFGGSSGREGAALQLGGSVASFLSSNKKFGLDKTDQSILTTCGMCGVFSALFGTPLAAAIFVLTIINVKNLYKKALVPCIFSSYTAFGIACLLKNSGVRYTIYINEYEKENVIKALIVSLICAFISIAFVYSIEYSKKFASYIKNEYLRIAVGGGLIILLTLLVGTNDYNGAGSDVIGRAIGGSAETEAFVLKLIFTSITLAFGYKGGEIVPSFFIGATFGCVAGNYLGANSSLCAAVGMMSVFSGVTNCPVASVIMAAEIFGIEHVWIFIPACFIAFIFSGRHSLYGSRQFLLGKWLKKHFTDK